MNEQEPTRLDKIKYDVVLVLRLVLWFVIPILCISLIWFVMGW